MSGEVTYRWLDGSTCTDVDWARMDKVLESQGWVPLNRECSRVYLAEQDGEIVGMSVQQLMPFCGPFYVDRKHRGQGVAEKLAADTIQSLVDMSARGWFVVADSPHIPRLCELHGMHRVESPVYITLGTGVSVVAAKEVA